MFYCLIFLNILAFQYCFSQFLSHVLCFFAGFLKIIAPRMGFWHYFSAPEDGFLHLLCAQGEGWDILPFKTIPWGLPGGGGRWSGLELADTLWLSRTTERTIRFHRSMMLLGALVFAFIDNRLSYYTVHPEVCQIVLLYKFRFKSHFL